MRVIWFLSGWLVFSAVTIAAPLPVEWTPHSPREELQPEFRYEPKGGDQGQPAIVITAKPSAAQQGWVEKVYHVSGGKAYHFETRRKAQDVASPRRSLVVRIRWTDANGKMVMDDIPPGHENDPGYAPLAEPEHPADGEPDSSGWAPVTGTYVAPSKAVRAVVELHLLWAASGQVTWTEPVFAETPPPPPREVRLATIHYQPSGKSPRQNCEEFAPLVAEAAKQKADLVVLGETVPYVGVKLKPHQTAEPIPGPLTEYFGSLAKENHLHLVVSLYERDQDAVYNTAILMGPDGQLIGKYRKVCLPHSEIEAGVAPGSDYPVFDTQLGKIGMMVCYDGFFPEVARELSNRGAEIIAWPVWGCNPLLARARACENHVFLVSSTYSGSSDWMISAVYDRAGQPIVKADKFGQIAITTVDLGVPHFWKNNLGDFRAMIPRHRPLGRGE